MDSNLVDRHVIAALVFAMPATIGLSAAQLLPPPRDGDIRTAYWELRNESEVWLTLEARTPEGDPAPLLTFTYWFPGKHQMKPPSDIELRAYAGAAVRVEFWLLLDGTRTLELARGRATLSSGTPSDYLAERLSLEPLRAIATAKRIEGNAFGIPFELRDSQRQALAAFYQRAAARRR